MDVINNFIQTLSFVNLIKEFVETKLNSSTQNINVLS